MGDMNTKVLVIDDERSVCHSCKVILRDEGHEVDYVTSGTEGVVRALQGDWDVVLLDLKMPDLSGMEVLERIKAERPEIMVIIITGYATIQTSIEAIKKGAFDYVPKPFTPEELSMTVQKALEDRAVRRENESLRRELSRLRGDNRFLGRSKEAEDIRRQILKVAPSQFTVTIYGDSGTGKEVIAREIHDSSTRSRKDFVAVDVSSLSPALIESELFGHVKGAFTGAARARPGCFAQAHGGTLFLDEISNINLESQGKLLRVLESRKVRPVGGEKELDVDVRLVAATNRDLFTMVEDGSFREDLYYRLNVIPIRVPPLLERSDDIPLLSMHFLKKGAARTATPVTGFSTEAMAKLLSYSWPGNVRELRNVVERMLATVDQPLVRVEHLPSEVRGDVPSQADPTRAAVPETVDGLKREKRRLKELVYARVEREFVLRALESTGWNVSRAAEAVGMQRSNFHALMRKHGVRRDA